jgi:hypothetical protein
MITMKDGMMIVSIVYIIALLGFFIGFTELSANVYETTGSTLLAIMMLIEGILATITTVSVWLITSYEMSKLPRRNK